MRAWIILALAGCAAAAPREAARDPVVLGYLPTWVARDVRLDRFTHVAQAFYSGPGSRGIPDRELLRAAREKGVKVLVSLGGAESGKRFRAADPRVLAAEVAAVVKDAGYDGVDVDWEPVEGEADRKGLVALVRALREALGKEVLLTMAAPATNWQGRWWDVEALRDAVDLLNVMTYDFHGPWSSHAGHNAPLRSVAEDKEDGGPSSFEAGIDYWLGRGWPKEKLLAGIPCYGRGFAAPAWYAKPTAKSRRESLSYREARRLLDAGAKRSWDAAAQVPWLGYEGGILSYEDAESAALKGRLAREKGIRGVFFWSVDQDFRDGDHEIVRAASAALR
jgi:chitinase